MIERTIQDDGLEWYGRYYAVYRGQITDRDDPDNLGRVKLIVPGIFDEEHDYWAWPVGQPAAQALAGFSVPDVGQTVWVMFENGNTRFPVWLPGWFAPGEAPGNLTSGYLIHFKGHRLFLDANENEVSLVHANGNYVNLNENGISFVRGSNKISLGKLGDSDEPAVLGDKNAARLTELSDQLKDLTTQMTQLATLCAAVPGGAAVSASIVAALTALQVEVASTRNLIPTTKSQNVSVDG